MYECVWVTACVVCTVGVYLYLISIHYIVCVQDQFPLGQLSLSYLTCRTLLCNYP